MLPSNGPFGFASGLGCQGEVARPHGIGCAPRDARKHRDVENTNGSDTDHQARPINGSEQNGGKQCGECKGEVGSAHDHLFDPTASGRCQQAQRYTQAQANAHRNETDQQRVLAAHQQERRNVTP